jgi:putative toxin-antitoxin system antitoxin component (TIGR02293 family)
MSYSISSFKLTEAMDTKTRTSTQRHTVRRRALRAKVGAFKPSEIFHATALDRVSMIRTRLPAAVVPGLVRQMDISKERLYAVLRFPRATVDRKIRVKGTLSTDQSERLLGLARLIGQVEEMVAQSGTAKGFDASRWIGEWLERPLPALGGAEPAEYMDTMEGQQLISRLLAQAQSGAYA